VGISGGPNKTFGGGGARMKHFGGGEGKVEKRKGQTKTFKCFTFDTVNSSGWTGLNLG